LGLAHAPTLIPYGLLNFSIYRALTPTYQKVEEFARTLELPLLKEFRNG
jgi:hypothetical protein